MSGMAPTAAATATAKELRKRRTRRMGLRLLIGVGLPTLLAAIYYGPVASPQYDSVSAFTVQSADGRGTGTLQFLMASVPGTAGRDIMLVQQYIHSRQMLAEIEREVEFRAHFSNPDIDYFSRLSADASVEERHEYYVDHISVEHDSQSGSLTLHVRAFDQAFAEELASAILSSSENMVNTMSDRSRTDRMELSQQELERAETRLAAARRALSEVQAQEHEFNPAQSAAAVIGIRSQLQTQVAIARAELSALTSTLQPTAPQVLQQRRRVAALQRQIREQNDSLAGDREGTLSHAIASFEPAVVEKEFAERAHASALTSLELARIEAQRQHRYLVRISGPSRPEDSSYPRFWYSVLTTLALSFALLGIGTLLVASVREHANV